ncbi:MAG TPA: hypothetical protein VF434_11225, partial [Promineifilum sp.]
IAAAVITLNGRESTVVVAPEAVAPAEAFDYEAAAELSGYRAREMARFYEANGLLTRPEVDLSIYTTAPGWEQAQLNLSGAEKALAVDEQFLTEPGWFQAGLYGSAEAVAAESIEAMRWQAMAEFYRKHNMLTRPEAEAEPFSTEPYWQAAADYEAQKAGSAPTAWEMEHGR